MDENIFDKRRLKTFSNCKDLVRCIVGTRDGVIVYNEKFRLDLENTCYKANICEKLQKELEQLKEINEEHQRINGELREEIKDLEFIIGLRTKRNLISKFDKEYDEEDKNKNPNRDYAAITPDAEEVYRRYYELKDRIDKAVEYINKISILEKGYINFMYELEKILKGDKE